MTNLTQTRHRYRTKWPGHGLWVLQPRSGPVQELLLLPCPPWDLQKHKMYITTSVLQNRKPYSAFKRTHDTNMIILSHNRLIRWVPMLSESKQCTYRKLRQFSNTALQTPSRTPWHTTRRNSISFYWIYLGKQRRGLLLVFKVSYKNKTILAVSRL